MGPMVTLHDSALGRWADHVWTPDESDVLDGVVEHVRYCEGSVAAQRERVLPSGAVDIVLHLTEPVRCVGRDGQVNTLPRMAVAGLRSAPLELQAASTAAAGVSIRLRPEGARALFGVPMSHLASRVEDLRDVIGTSADEVIERCADASGASDRISAAAEWLRRRLTCGVGVPAEVVGAIGEIVRSRGAVSIGGLRERTGWSKPRFVAAFREHVGMSPKGYARVVRFRRTLALLGQPARPGAGSFLSSVALVAGFADQAHMNADFRAFAGVTPGEFLSSARDPRTVSIAVHRSSIDTTVSSELRG